MFASRQFAACTLTNAHGVAAERPVRGSTRWWMVAPLRRHTRPIDEEVATPPPSITIRSSASLMVSFVLSNVRSRALSTIAMLQPGAGATPAVATSPPRLTHAPVARSSRTSRCAIRSAQCAFDVAPRSRRAPLWSAMVRRSRSITTSFAQVWTGGCSEPEPASIWEKSRSYPSAMSAPPTAGSTRPPERCTPRIAARR